MFLLAPTEKRNDSIGRMGFHISLTVSKWKLPHFLESENPVSKIFGGWKTKIYRKTIHVEMLTSWYTWNLKHLFINGCFTKHPLKTGCLGYQATISNLNFLNLCCSHGSRAWPSLFFGRRGPLLITFFGGVRCCLKSKTGSNASLLPFRAVMRMIPVDNFEL